ncbi:MAG TPA: PHP domain-containing protein [Nitrospirota bacterium]|nr:PHP domain-containing protein [Nitrospirota bacterium]
MKFKIDLHIHSQNSGDTDADPEQMVQRAIELGLHGIAFTEHYSYAASEPVARLREKYGNSIMIFRGVEFSAEQGHCLVFGVDTDALAIKYAPIEDVVRIVKEKGGVVIPSHPYRPGTSLGDHVLHVQGICAVEGYNGANMHEYNVRAVEAARRLKLPYTGGSDAHALKEVGSCFTEFSERVTYDNFIDLLRRGGYQGVDKRKISRMIIGH